MLWLKFLPTQNEWTFTLILKGLFTNSIQFAGPAIFIFQLYLFSEANWRFYSNFFWHKMSEHLHWSQGLKRYVLDLCDIFQVCILEKRHLCGREDSESYIFERKSMALQSHFQVRRGTCLGLSLHQVRIECIRTFKCGCIVVTVHCWREGCIGLYEPISRQSTYSMLNTVMRTKVLVRRFNKWKSWSLYSSKKINEQTPHTQ